MSTTLNPNPNALLKDAATIIDFNNDGRTDILWRNQDGQNGIWLMSGTQPNYYSSAAFVQTVPTAWNYSIGDFNSDGKTDLFWRNEDAGQSAIWLMDGTTISSGVVLPQTLSKEWKASIADVVNGDGKSEIFWRNEETGENRLWLIDGTNVDQRSVRSLAKEWNNSIADFNGDRRADIFWHNDETGDNAIWLNGNDRFDEPVSLPSLTGTVVEDYKIADFNGDGKTDVLARNSQTGETNIWLMDGTTITNQNQTSLPTNVPAAWDANIGDFDGNGKTDIFWRNSQTGDNAVWLMDGTNYTAAAPLQNVPVAWSAGIADFNGDGKTDIFWRNSQTGQDAVWLMNGTTYSDAAFLATVPTSWSPA